MKTLYIDSTKDSYINPSPAGDSEYKYFLDMVRDRNLGGCLEFLGERGFHGDAAIFLIGYFGGAV